MPRHSAGGQPIPGPKPSVRLKRDKLDPESWPDGQLVTDGSQRSLDVLVRRIEHRQRDGLKGFALIGQLDPAQLRTASDIVIEALADLGIAIAEDERMRRGGVR